MKEFMFTWRIENISFSWHDNEEWLKSPSFTADIIQNSVWYLQLFPRGDNIGDYFSLYLNRKDSGPKLSVNFEFSCVSAENELLHTITFPEDDKSFILWGGGFGHPRFMSRHEVFVRKKALYLPNDVLTLRCRMWIHEGSVHEFGRSVAFTCLWMERILLVENINTESVQAKNISINSKSQSKSLLTIDILKCDERIKVIVNPKEAESITFSVLKLLFIEKTTRKIFYEHISEWLGVPRQETWRMPVFCKEQENENGNSVKNVELLIDFAYSNGEKTDRLESEHPGSTRLCEFVSKYINSCIPSGNLTDSPGISQSLWNLYVEQALCDLELKTPKTSFFVHKTVLCARSPVLLAMLTGDMKEKMNKCIEIEDIGDDVLEKFLIFLYKDCFEDLEWKTVIGLYYAADKYQVERLRILCSSYFLKSINVDNVCELLMLADRHNDFHFKRRVEDFILLQDEKIFNSMVWKQFVDEQPFLPAKTMLLKYDTERGKQNDAEAYETMLCRCPTVDEDILTLYKDNILTDFVIKTAGTTFPVHKAVVCASSSTMREMLKDNPTDNLEIQDLEDDIVSRMLHFLYTDSFEDIEWGIAMKLYKAANLYQIQRLKIRCSCFLLENLDTSNAGDLLLFAHEHQDDKLKSVVEDYIFMHDEKIFGSDQWADFSKTNLHLANETMRSKYRKKI